MAEDGLNYIIIFGKLENKENKLIYMFSNTFWHWGDDGMGRALKVSMLVTDIGFVLYWLIIYLDLLPKEYLFKDYDNELMVAWNLSFIPLDLLITLTGLTSIYLFNKQLRIWSPYCIVSLSLTFCSGLQALAFWGLRHDFDVLWWLPNVCLLLYPLFFLPNLIKHAAYLK